MFDPLGPSPSSLGNQSSISNANLAKKLEVYVNGQLLASGSKVANKAPVDGDYVIHDYETADATSNGISGSFAFDLEPDDIITIIRKL
jgi:hypothetical protein